MTWIFLVMTLSKAGYLDHPQFPSATKTMSPYDAELKPTFMRQPRDVNR